MIYSDLESILISENDEKQNPQMSLIQINIKIMLVAVLVIN